MKYNITDNEDLHSFFSFVSKAVLITPIVIVILSLFFKFNQPKTGSVLPANSEISTFSPTISDAKNGSIKFDLVGPIVCNNLFIQNKKVFLRNKSINYLLYGDCLYTWENKANQGIKKCGLSTYIGLVENYLGFMNIDDLANNSLVKDKLQNKDIDLVNIIKSCKRREIKDKNIFEIPKKITFKP